MVTTGTGSSSASSNGAAVQLVKAYVYNEDKREKVVECKFNPTEYKFSKSNTWNPKDVTGQNVPMAHFQKGNPMTMTVSLLFDTYTEPGQPDVRKYTEKVLGLMRIDSSLQDNTSGTGRPPCVSFRWGKYWSFKSVITQIGQSFTLFMPDGRPVRAKLEVTFQQVQSEETTLPPQNPTSHSEIQKIRIVSPGETIDSIAFQEYGDAARWRMIADHNNLDDPLRLRAGQRLAIPPAV